MKHELSCESDGSFKVKTFRKNPSSPNFSSSPYCEVQTNSDFCQGSRASFLQWKGTVPSLDVTCTGTAPTFSNADWQNTSHDDNNLFCADNFPTVGQNEVNVDKWKTKKSKPKPHYKASVNCVPGGQLQMPYKMQQSGDPKWRTQCGVQIPSQKCAST